MTTTAGPPPAEQRKTERRALRVPATLKLPGGKTFTVQTLDISLGGLGILAPANARNGARLAVQVTLPAAAGAPVRIEVPVVVAHSILSRELDAFKVGLQFRSLDPKAESAIRHYVATHG